MENLIESAPIIIEQAAKSPLGIFALMILAISVLGFFFFRGSSEWSRIVIFVMMLAGVFAFGIAIFRSDAIHPAADTSSQTQAAAPVDITGTFQGDVNYTWAYKETFTFTVNGNSLSGTATYLGSPHAIFDGKVTGDAVTFAIRYEEILAGRGNERRLVTNFYNGTASENEIHLTMSNTKGSRPVVFTITK